ncbi:uncharacterized protein LOC143861341 [Tasmannia lanceolata]|uniref:uncharacterized protein LOC143861341 n=1 Tax=Tasmannia lanceolata TaxID=3420 RepID=UPI004062D23B
MEPSGDGEKTKNASWSSEMNAVLVQALRHESIEGGKILNGFKESAHKFAQVQINEACGTNLTVSQVKNHVKTMKANYKVLAEMLATSGFGWDDEKKKITVTKDVAMDYLKSYPERKRFFTSRHEFYEEMTEIFGDEYAHGSFKKLNRNVARSVEEESYIVNVANDEHEDLPETESQFDYMGTGSQFDYMNNDFLTQEAPHVPSPHTTSPPEESERSL